MLRRYVRWLHTQWPAGTVEKLPLVREDGTTNVPGLYVVGDLTGIPLLKLAADSGARAVQHILADPAFQRRDRSDLDLLDIAIVGGSVSGFAAALEARKHGLRYEVFEATEPFSTIVNFPKAKPIYTYPADMTPAGELQFHEKSGIKEGLVEDLLDQTVHAGIQPTMARVERVERHGALLHVVLAGREPVRAHRVIVGIGRSGNFRKLGVPGEELPKVYNRLHDPSDFAGQDVLVVGGGDSAAEAAIALAGSGARVTFSYRGRELTRPKPENVDKLRALAADPTADVAIEHPTSERVTTASGSFMRLGRGQRTNRLDSHATQAPGRPAEEAKQYRIGSPRSKDLGHPGQGEGHGQAALAHATRTDWEVGPTAPGGPGGGLRLALGSNVVGIREQDVTLRHDDAGEKTIANDAVFVMIGREAPLEFFRRSGVAIRGEWRLRTYVTLALFLLFCIGLYHWKSGQAFGGLSPAPIAQWVASAGGLAQAAADTPGNLLHVLRASMSQPGFYYSLAYCLCVTGFGIRRIRRRRTPYVKWQTLTLMLIQVVPLFLLPEILLPWAGENGWWSSGFGKSIGDTLWPNGEYWRAYGLILAWPLFVYNIFTEQPLWGWLIIGGLQTFVLIPWIIHYWGKGAYCGWICTCGALAETMGDAHRHKMPHGPAWNRLNMVGQVVLWVAGLLLVLRVLGWIWPESPAGAAFQWVFAKLPVLNYKYAVDLWLAGVLGVGMYFHFSGRVWCRFACPLAALMHIYARFSRFRILADKKKCISCNVCTAVCHQGIDVMNFANKGLPMADPQCVRCSACVQSCPTGVLSFGQVNRVSGDVVAEDPAWLAATALREPSSH